MTGILIVGLIAVASYLAGVPLPALLAAIIIGTWIEYRWIRKRH